MVIREAILRYRDRFLNAGIENAANEARHLISSVLGLPLSALLLHGDETLSPKAEERLEEQVQKRLSGIPLAYVLGTCEFFGRPFSVCDAVLIPRPETELLVEEALSRLPRNGRFFDLCTGSGCIAVTLAAEVQGATGLACDLSEAALSVAEKNARDLGVTERVTFYRHDLLSGLPDWEPADVIVSNPPYIRRDVVPTLDREVFVCEPTMALDGGEDGLDFYRVLSRSWERLKPGGWLLLEIGYDQGQDVSALLRQTGRFFDITIKPDYAGLDRMVLAQKR